MRIALALGFCLITCVAVAAPWNKAESAEARASAPMQSLRDTYRSRINQNVVTIMAGSPTGTDLTIAYDIARVVDDGDDLRVLPIVGQGAAQSVKDVMFLKGVDMGVTQANILKHFAKTGELGPNFVNEIVYIAKLFTEEVHIIVPSEVTDIHELSGKPVSLGETGSGTAITGNLLLAALGIDVKELHLSDAEAIEKLKAGEIAAAIVMAAKPGAAVANLTAADHLKLLPIPYTKDLEDSYYPATFSHDDYPALVAAGEDVDSVSVCTVLVSFNWDRDSVRYRRVAKFVDAFFDKFDEIQQPPHHPKWREVNFAATLEGWHRSPASQDWIDRATAGNAGNSTASKTSFDTFLAQKPELNGTRISEAQRAELFRAFLEWNKNQQ
jgi:TRAP transporter TAXI family solute receptor